MAQQEEITRLVKLLGNAEHEHHEAERRLAPHSWIDWYAAYMYARSSGLIGPYAISYADTYIIEKHGVRADTVTSA